MMLSSEESHFLVILRSIYFVTQRILTVLSEARYRDNIALYESFCRLPCAAVTSLESCLL